MAARQRFLSVDLDLRTHGAGAYRSLRRAGGDGVSIRSQGVADIRENSGSRLSVAGNHTSVPHILKVLNPLFLDDLRKQLNEAGGNERKQPDRA